MAITQQDTYIQSVNTSHRDARTRKAAEELLLNDAHRFFESKVCANKGEWDRDAEPEGKESEEGGEGHRGTAPHHPHDQVEHKEDPKDHPARLNSHRVAAQPTSSQHRKI